MPGFAAGFDNYNTGPKAMLGGGGSGSGGTTVGSGGGSGSTSSSQTVSDSHTKTHETEDSHTHVQNMDDASLAALDKLIAQLEAGGTDNMLVDRANRLAAILSAQTQQAAYSHDAAFRDAQGAMDQETRRVMQSILPQMTRSAEGAGTSQNSLRALLQQQAAQQAAESASAIGLKAATDYGQVSNGISAILAQLVAIKDPAADALLQALGIAKGAVQDSTTHTVKDGTSDTHSTSSTTGSTTNFNNNVGIAPSGGGGFSSGGFNLPSKPAVSSNNFMMSASGPLYDTGGSSGLSGLSFGSSGQSMSNFLGLPNNDGFTLG